MPRGFGAILLLAWLFVSGLHKMKRVVHQDTAVLHDRSHVDAGHWVTVHDLAIKVEVVANERRHFSARRTY